MSDVKSFCDRERKCVCGIECVSLCGVVCDMRDVKENERRRKRESACVCVEQCVICREPLR